MTIGVDIRVLASGVRSGVEEYTEHLLEHLLPLDTTIQYKLFSSSWRGHTPDYLWMHASNVRVTQLRIPSKALFLGAKLLDMPNLDTLVRGADVFFLPHFLLAPLSRRCKRVTTFHDVSYAIFPEFFPSRRTGWHWFMNPSWQARMSDRIIAVSDSTKHDVARICRVDPAKIEVVHSGVLPARVWSKEKLENFRNNHDLPERYILSLGTLEPRKNIEGIIRAFEHVAGESAFADLHLVIAGRKGWLWQDALTVARRSPYTRRIHIRGEISDQERPGYYQLASALLYPSFLEGFGFPPLEAMAHHVPVIVSANSSLPEIVRDAAVCVDPYNVRQVADALRCILIDDALRAWLIERGNVLVKERNWHKTAQKTLDILMRA